MPIPWLRLLNAVLYSIDLGRAGTRLANVRESPVKGELPRAWFGSWVTEWEQRRMEFERERMEVERQRVERALKLDLLRQAGDREIGRLRLMAGIAAASLIGTLVFFGQVVSTLFAALRPGTRLMLVAGWILILVALVLSYSGQARVALTLAQVSEPSGRERPSAGMVGALVPWFIALGLVLVGLAAFTI
jgi:hypothetical protein